jgi:pyridinium-3,5-bisthiocarboxylic acid mononucleotide nickel chelatase
VTKSLVVDAFAGAAGDMLLAALIDAGGAVKTLQDFAGSVPALAKVRVDIESVRRGAFAAKKLAVTLPHEHAHRGLADINKIIDSAPFLSPVVRAHVKTAFARLAAAEAKVHGTTVDKIHFHEVGALDAILDVVGFFVLAESLGIRSFYYTNLAVGQGGTVRGAHGEMPVPAPATLELLSGHRLSFTDRQEELMTPTAAAIIAAAFKPLPADAAWKQEAVGYGAGTRESAGLPNVVRVAIGHIEEIPAAAGSHEVSVIRCTIDDMNPELYGDLMQRLFDEEALEVYYTSVMMKKNRPGIEVTVLCEHARLDALGKLMLTHTTTLGLRVSREGRIELPRRVENVETEWGPARIKVATRPDGSQSASPEYESCREISRRTGATMSDVFDAVRRAWLQR